MSGTVTPSPAAAFSTAALSDAEKADIRRFAGYPPFGAGIAGSASWRFFTSYGLAEYRMNNMAPAEYQNLRYYVTQLYNLESAIWSASSNLDTDQAAVWYHNKNEVADRDRLFRMHRTRLCSLLGVPPGPDIGGNSFDVVI